MRATLLLAVAVAVCAGASASACTGANGDNPFQGTGHAGSASGASGSSSSASGSGGSSGSAGTTSNAGSSSAGAIGSLGGASNGSGGGSESGGAGGANAGMSSGGAATSGAGLGGIGGALAGSSGAASGGAGGAGGGDDGTLPGWTLSWHDEFDGPKGAAPDSTKWTPRAERWTANEELEYYTGRPENVSLDGNGFLNITARKESYMGASYTSARLETEKKFEQKYGRFQTRCKIPRGQGIWPAFWIMGNNGDAGWPGRGELDILENRGKEPTITLGAMHGPGYSGGMDFRAEHVIAEGVWMNFHVFALEWEENVTRWYVDDELFETRTPKDLADRGGNLKWVYDHPFFIIMNVAVGGKFPGNPDATTPLPQTLSCDYVRVYTR